MKLRLAAPTLLVDISRLAELRGVERQNGSWRIGGGTRHADLQDRDDLGVVARAASLIADQQVRNRGTIGGSLAHGDPASDLPAVVLAAEGELERAGPGGERTIAAADMFQDYLTTSVASDEVITAVNLPALDGFRWGYEKFAPAPRTGRWSASSRSSRRPTATARTSASASRTWARPRCGRPRPRRRCAAGRLDAERIAAAAEQAAEGTEPAGDLNATPEYKQHLARVLTGRALSRRPGPGWVIMSESPAPGLTDPAAVREALAEQGYLADDGLAVSVFLALELGSRCCSRARPGSARRRPRRRSPR